MEIEYKRVWGGDKSKAWSVGKYPSADAFVTPAKVSIYLPLSYDNRATELIGVDRGVNLHRFIYLYYSAHCEWNYAGGLNYVSEPVGKARKDQYLGPDAHVLAYYQIARNVYTVDIFDKALNEVWKGDLPMEDLIKLRS